MGYQLKKRRLTLKFEDSVYAGAEVVCDLSASVGLVEDVQLASSKDIKDFHRLMREEVILEWNLEDADSVAVPLDEEGFKSVGHNFIMAIVSGWGKGVGNIDAPLEDKSNNGHSPDPALALMENFKENQPSPSTSGGSIMCAFDTASCRLKSMRSLCTI